MELKMNEYQLPEKILFNYEELKQELTEKVSMYETLVYTEESIKDAKADRANLNKLKKALNDERIRLEREYLRPFSDFKDKITEIIRIIDKPVELIDSQIKEYENKQKQDKLNEITLFFNNAEHPDWLHLSQIMDSKWVNASVSMKSIQDAINARLDQVEIDLSTLHSLPEFGFEATEVYKTTLDMSKAITEAKRMSEIAKRKAEEEARKKEEEAKKEYAKPEIIPAEQLPGQISFNSAESFDAYTKESVQNEQAFENCMNPPEPAKQWVSFAALLSTEDAIALKQFFDGRNIEFKRV